MTSSSDLLSAGVVGRPHGLDGSFHVLRARRELLERGAEVTVAGQARTIVRRAGLPGRPILRLSGVDTRTAIEALGGTDLQVSRSRVDPLGEGEYWPEQLEGCAVVDGDRPVGVVRRLLAYPSCELLEVQREGGGELLIPMVRDAIRAVDVDGRRIEVDLAFLGEAG